MYFKKILLLLVFVTTSLLSFSQKKNQKTEKFIVQGNCEHCKERIETTLKKAGTFKAKWSPETKYLLVSFDSMKLSKKLLQQKLVDVGHTSEGFFVKKEVYDDLPGCCQYDDVIFYEDSIKKVNIDSTSKKEIETKIEATKPASYVTETKVIKPKAGLDSVEVRTKNFGTNINARVVTNTLNITQKELRKAACCNLSESFETSPSVDVSYTDAVTGIKQIQLLGLSGSYTQITTENVAELRGLSGSFGLTFIPGTVIEGIQLTKGVGSVANGFESIAGQINIEQKKTVATEKIFFNAYANNIGRTESTLNLHKKINNTLSTALFLHSNRLSSNKDANNDGFLDNANGNQINLMNRWLYENEKGIEVQFIVKALKDKRIAGDVNFNENLHKLQNVKYGVGMDVEQYNVSGKLGYLFKNKPYQSIGLMISNTSFTNNSYFGLKEYAATQNSFYSNLIFQSIIGRTIHKYRVGASFVRDNFHEKYGNNHFNREEIVPGAFVEYTYTPNEKFTTIVGLRADKHNYFDWFTTTRLNTKYNFNKNTALRFGIGNGTKMANIYAENTGYLVSSRQVTINANNNFGFGLNQEKAWNYGISLNHKFKHNNRPGNINIDYFRTDFTNQTVVDVDTDAQQIIFSNLNGLSFSNSYQFEMNYEPIEKFDVRLAYRYLDVQTSFNNKLLEKPLIAKHRAFLNLAYQTKNNWIFDLTTQWIGAKRLPTTHNNPIGKQMMHNSPSYWQVAAQVTKQFSKKFDLYIGAENATNYMQQDLIIDAQNPFGNFFDASMVWGPMNGRIIYLGLRWKVL